MPEPGGLSPLGALVRRHDPDRYLAGLFAPAAKREALWALYAFNHELARAREAAREPMAALIRLHWWREVAEGARRRHEVAEPLGAALDAGLLDAAALGALVDAREAETAPVGTMADFEAYLRGTAGGLMVQAARLLGHPEPEVLRGPGAAFGLAGVLRSAPLLAAQGRCVLPVALLDERRLTLGALGAGQPGLLALRQELAGAGRRWLDRPGRTPREARAASLPLVLARRDLLRPARMARPRGTGDRLALVAAGVTGWGA